MIPNYFEAIEDEKYQSIRSFNFETFCSKEIKKFLVCVFDLEKDAKSGLRQ